MSGEVVDFDPQALPLVPRRRPGRMCDHSTVYVVEETRMLECRTCGATVEPFDYLWSWAEKSQRLASSVKYHREELERINARIEELKREERNLKARVRRAKESAG